MIRRTSTARKHDRRGGALLFALIVVTSVTAICVSLLRITNVAASRQRHAVDDKRAFYLAEAGLSQAYYGLGAGMTGQVGTIGAPALVGDGLAWVDAVERDDGTVALRSTGMCGAGRATLELVVEPHSEIVGVFADEDISIDVPILLDGYDPEQPYYDQVRGGAISIDPNYPFLHVDSSNQILFYEELFYRYYKVEGNNYYYDVVLDYRAHPLEDVDWDDFIDLDDFDIDDDVWEKLATLEGAERDAYLVQLDLGEHEDFDDVEYKRVLEYFASIPKEPVPFFKPAPTALGPTTSINGLIGSNGSIDLSSTTSTTTIYGDVMPGKGTNVSTGANVVITGSTKARTDAVDLSAVNPPDVALLPAINHDSDIPKVVPPGIVGYEGIRVAADSELVIQGPGSLVVGDLQLDPYGLLMIENSGGAVEVFVTQGATLAQESRVLVETQETSQLSLQGSASATQLDLRARSQFHGTVYAPDSHVAVGSNFEIYGALVANTLSLEPGARLHCNTGDALGSAPLPRVKGWRIEEVPERVRTIRTSPEQLLGIDKAELKPLSEAGVSGSWHLTVGYFDHSMKQVAYNGPFEKFDATQVKFFSFFPLPKLTPPDAEFTAAHGEWTMYIQYKTAFGKVEEFTGTVAQFASSVMFKVALVLSQEVRKP